MSGDADLAAFAARLRKLKNAPEELAKDAAPLVEAAVKETAAAGTDLDGNPWPAKKDGGRALPNAASAVRAMANGAFVIIKLIGPYVFHQYAKPADRKRPILPVSGAELPKRIADVLIAASKKTFVRLMK